MLLGWPLLVPQAMNAQDVSLAKFPDSGDSQPMQALAAWRGMHGRAWRLVRDPHSPFAAVVYGGSATASFSPVNDADWIEVAREHIVATCGMHGVDAGTLVPVERSVRFLPVGRLPRGVDKVAVRLRQVAGEIPVDDGFFNVLMQADGTLVATQSTASPFLDELAFSARLSSAEAEDLAISRFVELVGVTPDEIKPATIAIIQVIDGFQRRPRLAWKMDLRLLHSVRPEGWKLWLDGDTGTLLREEPVVRAFDVGGTLCAWATPGSIPDTDANPEVAMEVPYARVEAAGGLVTYTDRYGHWSFAGQSGPLDVTFRFMGSHVTVQDASGADYVQTENGLTGSNNAVVMNAIRDEYTTAEANAYIVANRVGDYIRDVQCDESTTCDTTVPDDAFAIIVNESPCTANATGSTVHLGRESANCRNAAFSTIIAHELGHLLNDRYGTAHGGGEVDEGTADIWAMYVFDTPHIGEGLRNSKPYERTGGSANMSPFCGDLVDDCCGDDNEPCEEHSAGLKWMGAAWKVREALNDRYDPDAIGDMIADTLFVSWMNAFTHPSKIESVFQLEWLLLDDDNGDLDDGTPNQCEITAGFSAHGFPDLCLSGTCP